MKIKICGLSREEDIDAVNTVLPDYVGFVFVPGSTRYVNYEHAQELKGKLSKKISAVGVFADEEPEMIESMARDGIIDLIQLHGDEGVNDVETLKRVCGIPIIKAISMNSYKHRESIRKFEESSVDYLLLDSAKGGSGQMFDHRCISNIKKPFFLAGGLTSENVGEILKDVPIVPYAVDMSSGVETNGRKDKEKICKAVRRMRDVER